MQLIHFYHRHHLYRLANHPDFSLFELSIWLHTLARSLIAVFIPVLLFTSGYSISTIIIFYLVFSIIDLPLNFVVADLMRKIGARKVMIVGTLAIIAFFGLLGILPPANLPFIFLLAFLGAIYDTFFWIAHIYIFIEANREGLEIRKAVGALEVVKKLANIAGPLVGAFLLLAWGRSSLVLASIVIFALSIVPLFNIRNVRDVSHEKKLSFHKFFLDLKEKRNYLSLALWGVHDEVDGVLWPLFIFILFGTIESVAAVPVIVSVCTAIFPYLAGKLTKRYETRMIILGSLIIACVWIFRLTFQSAFFYYASIFLVGIFSLLVSIPLDVSITTRGLKIGSLAAATYRNVTAMAFRIPLYITLILLVEVFKMSFAIAAVSLFVIIYVVVALSSKLNHDVVHN